MRNFFILCGLLILLAVGMFGWRGKLGWKAPYRISSDMAEQDKLKAQARDNYFADGLGARTPPQGTRPNGYDTDGGKLHTIDRVEFSGTGNYYYTGKIGDFFGTGLPAHLKSKSAAYLLRRGEQRYNIYCSVCHGVSGDGSGIMVKYGLPVSANPNAKLNSLSSDKYPEGKIFHTITNGKGLMSGYGDVIPVGDRWAIICYLKALQQAAKTTQAK